MEINSDVKKTIICYGDSLVAGNLSYDWVSDLGISALPYTTINKGINGITTKVLKTNIKKDIAELKLKASNEQIIITILIGVNDIIGAVHPSAGKMYMTMFKGIQNEIPSLLEYEKDIRQIITFLDKELPFSAKVVIMSPPPVGEGGVNSEEWKLAAEFNTKCKVESFKASNRIYFLNLYDVVRKDMLSHECNKPLSLSIIRFTFNKILYNFINLEKIRKINRFNYTCDGIHFCKEFGNICENLLLDWLYDNYFVF